MTIMEYADAIDKEIVITYYPNQGTRFSAHFDNAETKDDMILSSVFGSGSTPALALKDYAGKIAGKTLVFNATTDRRQTFRVPDKITG